MKLPVRIALWSGAALLLLAVSVVWSLSIGSAGMPASKVWSILIHRLPIAGGAAPDWTPMEEAIVMQVRLSRVTLAVLVGACLGMAGAGFQGVLRNPLAEPYTLGVASGSSVGAALVMTLGLQSAFGLWSVPFAAFLSGLLAVITVFLMARSNRQMSVETLILSGVILQAFLGAFVTLMISMADDEVNQILFWVLGSLSKKSWEHALLLLPFAVLGLPVIAAFASAMNLMALGERHAAHLGVHVERTKLIVLLASTLVTAAAVSVSGVIGFVGLVVPHLVRLTVGPDYRIIVPLSAIGGGIYVTWADTLARTALSPKEIPLGVLTALVGAPFFAWLLWRRKAGLGREDA